MFVRSLAECAEFVVGDGTLLREILHPDKADLRLRYSLAHAALGPDAASLPHRLSFSEVYHILEGEGVMHIGSEARAIAAGDTVYIPPGAVQRIENTGAGELRFLCIVDPAWRPDCEELVEV